MSNSKNRFNIRSQILFEEGNRIRIVGNFIRTGFTTPIGKPSRTFLFQNLRLIEEDEHFVQINTPHLWIKELEILNPEMLRGILRNARVIFEGDAMSYTAGFVKPKCLKGGLTSVKILSIEEPTETELAFLSGLNNPSQSNASMKAKKKLVKSLFSSIRRASTDDGWKKEKEKLAKYGFDL